MTKFLLNLTERGYIPDFLIKRAALFLSNRRLAESDIEKNKENVINRSKAVGEPPFMLAISSFIALKDAIYNATKGKNSENLIAPANAENI